MKQLTNDQLVTATGGAAGSTQGSWIKPLPAALTSPKLNWNLGPKASGATSWL